MRQFARRRANGPSRRLARLRRVGVRSRRVVRVARKRCKAPVHGHVSCRVVCKARASVDSLVCPSGPPAPSRVSLRESFAGLQRAGMPNATAEKTNLLMSAFCCSRTDQNAVSRNPDQAKCKALILHTLLTPVKTQTWASLFAKYRFDADCTIADTPRLQCTAR